MTKLPDGVVRNVNAFTRESDGVVLATCTAYLTPKDHLDKK